MQKSPITLIEEESHMIISTDTKKSVPQNIIPFMIKALSTLRIGGNFCDLIKGFLRASHWYHTQQWERKTFPLRSGTKRGCPLSAAFNSTWYYRPRKGNNDDQIGKKDKIICFSQMTSYI